MIESLEHRRLFSTTTTTGGMPPVTTVGGSVFFDKDRSGDRTDRLHDADTNVTRADIYLDANRNGKFDAGEHSGATNKMGNYLFSNLTTAETESPVRPILKAGQSVTTNENGRQIGIWNLECNATFALDAVVLNAPSTAGGTRNDVRIAGVRIYVDLNRNGKREKGEPTGDTTGDLATPTLLNVTPGKYRLRIYAPKGYRADRRYAEVRVSDRETRTWTMRMTPTDSINIAFYEDVNRNNKRDPGERLRAGVGWLSIQSLAVQGFGSGGYVYSADSDGIVRIRNVVPGAIKVMYERGRKVDGAWSTTGELPTHTLVAGWADGTMLEFWMNSLNA
jgi:hypothetical protein